MNGFLEELPGYPWLSVKDGDRRAFQLFKRHYSYRDYADGRRRWPGYRNRFLMAGPGGKMILITQAADALFVWRRFIDDSGQAGVNCAVFRNEGPLLSSLLITAAAELALLRWPGERLYTYVKPDAIQSANPGYCFKMAGWSFCGHTKSGLAILEYIPRAAT